MVLKEFPMYSPHPKGKLYERFDDHAQIPTINRIVKLDGNGTVTDTVFSAFLVELNNYFNYHNFKWVFETELQSEQRETMQGLINNSIYITIKTNCLKEIKSGDILYLECGMWRKGKYFVVTGQPKRDYIYTPKMRPTYQHLELRSLM